MKILRRPKMAMFEKQVEPLAITDNPEAEVLAIVGVINIDERWWLTDEIAKPKCKPYFLVDIESGWIITDGKRFYDVQQELLYKARGIQPIIVNGKRGAYIVGCEECCNL